MSKLDEIFDRFLGTVYNDSVDEKGYVRAVVKREPFTKLKEETKALFLELIDQVLRELPDEPTNQVNYTVSKLRQKVEEL